jgi:putative oxidoreductase
MSLLDWPGHRWLSFTVRIYLGAVFLSACWHKILHPGLFALDVATYDILPLGLVNLQAIILPWVELVAAVLLLLGVRSRAAAMLICGMMLMFIVAVSLAFSKGIDTSCGCFASTTAGEDPISWWTIGRDLFWLALSGYAVIFDRAPIGLERPSLQGSAPNA